MNTIKAASIKAASISFSLTQLKIVVLIVNDSGGSAVPGDVAIFIDGVAVTNDTYYSLPAGAHVCTYTPLAGYTASSWTGDANADGTITLVSGNNHNARITFSDN